MLELSDLQSLIKYVTDPRGPHFYRDFHAFSSAEPRALSSLEEWRSLPLLTKEAMQSAPLNERLFAPLSSLDHLRATSGTSGKPPLMCPRMHLEGLAYRAEYHDFKGACLAFTVPIMPHWHEWFQTSLGHSPRVIVFDPRRPRASVRLAKAAGVDSISVFAFHMPLISELMTKEGIGENIRFIEIAGEACSQALFRHLRSVFPNAVIIPFYGATEVEDCPIGMPCRAITGEEPLAVYHGKSTHYLELIDPETEKVVEPHKGAEGELLISTYVKDRSVFPLVRYRTGDVVRVVHESCDRHKTWSFTVLGRVASDFVKIPGGMLRADEIERVLRSFEGDISDVFELHRYDKEIQGQVKPEIILHVETSRPLEALAGEIASRLRVNPVRTYQEGVLDGLYAPLACVPLTNAGDARKRKRMVHHT